MAEITTHGEQETISAGKTFAARLTPGSVVALFGDLGAGKTTLVQGVAQGWGALDPVSSPTFVLVNAYRRPDSRQLFHFDAYRVESLGEAEELDIDTLLSQGPLLVEWPERVEPILPAERLWAWLEYESEEHRAMRFSACGERYESLLDHFRQNIYGGN
jgi:tRNA threonylcarbamoyladenosine biosynthesis protein TsaE